MADLFDDLGYNPWFSMGAGILSESGRGVPTGQAVGRGILSGMQNMRRQEQVRAQADAQRGLANYRQFQMEQARAKAEREQAEADLAAQQREQISQWADQNIQDPMQRMFAKQFPEQFFEAQARAQRAVAEGPDLSKTPTYVRDAEGNLQIVQLSSGGQPYVTPLPEGMSPVRPFQAIDYGAGTALLPYGSAQPQGVIPRQLPPEARPETRAAQTAATETAKQQTAAQFALPQVQETASEINRQIDELINHPGIDWGTGATAALPSPYGTDKRDFDSRKEQLAGGAFLQAYERLKGGGQITEIEGLKAEQAISRMNTEGLKKEDFIKAAEDFRAVVNSALKRARRKAGAEENEGEGMSGGELSPDEQAELDELRRTQDGRRRDVPRLTGLQGL